MSSIMVLFNNFLTYWNLPEQMIWRGLRTERFQSRHSLLTLFCLVLAGRQTDQQGALGQVHTIPRYRIEASRSHTLNMVPERLAKRVWCAKSQSSPLNINFLLSGFQSSLLSTPFSNSARRSFASLQNSRQNHRSYVHLVGQRW